jgi:hypothetical protein
MLVVVLSLGVAAWASDQQDVQVNWHANSWIILYVPTADQTVDLGTIDGSQYDPATDTWSAISDGNDHTAYVITNSAGGFTLSISAANATGYNTAALTRFQMKGGDLAAWTSLDSAQQILSGTSAGVASATDINYQYIPSWDD